MNIKVVAAYVRLLADYRFGTGGAPSRGSHADLSGWTMQDAVAVWHGFRYGVPGAAPGTARGFETVEHFQNRSLALDMLVDMAAGIGKEGSMYGSVQYFQYYFDR